MDGVIANFEKRYIELFNESPGSARDRKMFSKNWTKFIEGKHFETLDWWPGASELITYVSTNFPHSSQAVATAVGRVYVIHTLHKEGIIKDTDNVHLLGCAVPQEFVHYKDMPFITTIDTSNHHIPHRT